MLALHLYEVVISLVEVLVVVVNDILGDRFLSPRRGSPSSGSHVYLGILYFSRSDCGLVV